MRLLDLGCGSGAAADYLASRCSVEILCVTNSRAQADICQRKFEKFEGRVRVIVADFDDLDLPGESFDAIYALESIGYTKDLEAWLARCWQSLKPGGHLLIRSPGSLDHCHREQDYRNVTAFFENWRYNFLGANLLVFKLRRLGFSPIRYRQLPFWAWGLTWNFIQHLLLWSFGCGCELWWNWNVSFGDSAMPTMSFLPASPWRPSTSVADEPSPPIAVRSSKGRVAAYDLFCDRVLRDGSIAVIE
jgi:SAM-dependent methyltransferase